MYGSGGTKLRETQCKKTPSAGPGPIGAGRTTGVASIVEKWKNKILNLTAKGVAFSLSLVHILDFRNHMTRLIGSVRPPVFQVRSRLLIWLLIYVSNLSDNWPRLLVLAQTEGYIKYMCSYIPARRCGRTPTKLVICIATPISIAH